MKSTYILVNAKKLKLIENLGGACKNCGETRFWTLHFHHPDKNKEKSFHYLKTMRFSLIEKESKKCILLCSNCHTELHDNEINKELPQNNRRLRNKQCLLDYKNATSCQICDYNKCSKSLHFHHLDSNKKEFELSSLVQSATYKSKEDIPKYVIEELHKTIVICSNCHMTEHFNKERFDTHQNEILIKKENIKELSTPFDRSEILRLYNLGMTVTQIAKHFNTNKSTIGTITRKLGLGKSIDKKIGSPYPIQTNTF